MSPTRVLIIGAGVGGLALAQGLQRRQINFAVFERDALLDSRMQGYRIKIFGQMEGRLRGLLTDSAWAEFQATCAETHLGETTLNATDASVLACRRGRLPPDASLPYTADRGMLRSAMMKGIESAVHFGKTCTHYELEVDGNGVSVFFTDGSVEHGSLLVGADGSRSIICRQMLPNLHFRNTQGCCIYGKSFLSDDLERRFPSEHRRWITVVLDQTPILQTIISGDAPLALVTEQVSFPQHARTTRPNLPEDYVHWGLMFPQTVCGFDAVTLESVLKDPVKAAALARELTQEWHPSIRALLELQDESLTMGMRMISAGPNIATWTSSASITIMGDAIHVMSPSGGVGAVAALHDASVLAQTIGEGVTAEAIGKYESSMRAFAKECIERSFLAGEKMLKMPPFERCSEVELW